MDLIDRKAAVEYLMTNMGWHDEDGYEVDDADEKRTIIEDLINGIPSVPAVPLDKLCNLLHDLYGAPCNISTGEDKCVDLIGDACDTTWGDEECWKQFLTKWMEGLDDKQTV